MRVFCLYTKRICALGSAAYALLQVSGAYAGDLPCSPATNYQYVLITSAEIRDAPGAPAVGDLIAHRRSRGISATVVAMEDILSVPAYRGVDDAETLRNFIRDARGNWRTEFILLAGDETIVPIRLLWASAGIATPHQAVSDLYFQCLDGTFNSDGDDKWGEPTDGPNGTDVDLFAEVHIGRAPVRNAVEMSNFIYKLLRYENASADDEYLRTTLMIGEALGLEYGPGEFGCGYSYLQQLRLGATGAGYTTTGFAACAGMSVDMLTDWERSQNELPGWNSTNVIAMLSSNHYSIINHVACRGSYYLAMRMEQDDADSVTNSKPFFCYTQSPRCGDFREDSIAERLLCSDRSGAFAMVCHSDWGTAGWYKHPSSSYDTLDGSGQRFHRQFWNGYFGEGLATLGALNAYSHEKSIWLLSRWGTRICMYETNLLGDPCTPLRGAGQPPRIEAPMVSVDDSVGGNGDSVINPGETVDLAISLRNDGLLDATNVSATLVSFDWNVTVRAAASTSFYGVIQGAMGRKTGSSSFSMHVSTNCPTPHEVILQLRSVSGAIAWTNSVVLQILESTGSMAPSSLMVNRCRTRLFSTQAQSPGARR